MCEPLSIAGEVRGMIAVFNKSEANEFFRQDDERLISLISGQLARSVEAYELRDEKIKAERLVSIGNMMSTIVHDLRTPMNNIYGFVDLMSEEEDAELRSEFAGVVRDQIKILKP